MRIDFVCFIEFEDFGRKLCQSEDAANFMLCDAKMDCNVARGPAFGGKRAEGFVLFHFGGWHAGDVFNDGRFDGGGVIVFVHDCARYARIGGILFCNLFEREETPAPCDDAVAIFFFAHEQGLGEAFVTNAWQDVGHVRCLAGVAHIEF